MRAIIYRETGDPTVLQLVERTPPTPANGEVLVKIEYSGVNPTDWKSRRGAKPGDSLQFAEVVPNQDGSGTIIEVGEGVSPSRIGQRVWIWEAAYQRANGTAQEMVAIAQSQAVPLPDSASFEQGASLGIPALTAHCCLTVYPGCDGRLAPGSLGGKVVLVAGGAGAVGHAAIQLARWAGAEVITTVSSLDKEVLAKAAGAHHVVNYRSSDPIAEIGKLASNGIDIVVEVAPFANNQLDRAVIASNGTIAIYANDGDQMQLPIRPSMMANTRYQFVMVYSVPKIAKKQAVEDVERALVDGVLTVGQDAGMPIHYFSLEDTAKAHEAVENSIVGKVLIGMAR